METTATTGTCIQESKQQILTIGYSGSISRFEGWTWHPGSGFDRFRETRWTFPERRETRVGRFRETLDRFRETR